MKCFYVFFFLILFSSFAHAFPAPQGFVNDFADILSPEDEMRITSLLSELKENNTVEIAVVTLSSLEGQSIEQVAVDLFSQWGIGNEKKDNGLLILVAPTERAYRIEVGYGLEGLLNDAKAGRIGRDYFAPAFQQDAYGEGIYQALLAIADILRGQEEVIAESIEIPVLPLMIGFGWFIVFIVFSLYFKKKKNTRAQNVLGGLHFIFILIAYFISLVLFIFLIFLFLIYLLIIFSTAHVSQGYRSYGGPRFGGGFGRPGGGFGGFGGGSSGGGGASGRF